MVVGTRTFEELALANPRLELHHGEVREKPAMSWDHTDLKSKLGFLLHGQLDRSRFRVHIDGAYVRRLGGAYYIPDIAVIPTEYGDPFRGRPGVLAVQDAPLPLVVEVWSRSTGDYDVDEKLPEYEQRGDQEIWRLHPYERTLIARRRQAEGTYLEQTYHNGIVPSIALPGVEIDLDRLFDDV